MTRWSILPAYLVRLAGFAFERLEPLRCPRAAAADGMLEAAMIARRTVGQALDEALSQERYATNPAFDDPAIRKVLSRHVKHARSFARQLVITAVPPTESLSEVVRVVPHVAPLVAQLGDAHARWQELGRSYEATFSDELESTRVAIRRMYGDDLRLQEAVFLESPEAFDRITQLVATSGPRNARARQRERLAVMYAQRFCAKNDTNSICGPHGVAYMTDAAGEVATIEVVVEEGRRETYFSHWAAQRLLDEAVRLAGDSARTTLRIHPSARLEASSVAWCVMDHDSTTAFHRRYARSELPPAGVQLLRAMAQPRTPAELIALADELELGADEITSFVDELVGAGVVLCGPTLAPGLFHPLRAVATEVEQWTPSEARTWALAEVLAIEELVGAFARAPLQGRLEVFQQLVARFEATTGDAAKRGEGRHYADRSILHEDCYAEVTSQLGGVRASLDGTLPVLMAALELPLELSRERVREWFRARFGADVAVPALEAHRAFDEDHVLATPASGPHAAALRQAIERARDVIARAVTTPEVPARITTDELRGALAEIPAPARAGYISVDVMLRHVPDASPELVLGEVHGFFWLPTCLLDVLPPEHRERVVDQMRAAVREMANGTPTAECVFMHTQATDRRFPIATSDLQLFVPSDRTDALDLGALDLRLTGDEFVFSRDGEEVVPMVAYTSYPFMLYTSRIAPLFDDFSERFFPDSLLAPELREGDAPRLVLDDIVVRRRLWRRPAVAVRAALASTTEAELFRRAQALRNDLGCDTRIFVSLSGEPKPVLLDFHNVFLLEALVNLLERQADDAVVKFSEMLPGPGELVARGADGLRTSELRMGFYRTARR